MPTEELNIRISADSKDLDKGLDDASKKVDKFGKKTEETGKKIDDMAKKAEKGSQTISKAMSALLTGITAAATIKKGCVVVCNSDISAYQWRDSFLSFCDIKSDQIRIMVKTSTVWYNRGSVMLRSH